MYVCQYTRMYRYDFIEQIGQYFIFMYRLYSLPMFLSRNNLFLYAPHKTHVITINKKIFIGE